MTTEQAKQVNLDKHGSIGVYVKGYGKGNLTIVRYVCDEVDGCYVHTAGGEARWHDPSIVQIDEAELEALIRSENAEKVFQDR